jgi:hypothetical protein
LALGVLVASAIRAEADCRPQGKPIFEIEQAADAPAKLATADTKLYANGAWTTRYRDVQRTVARTTTGCLTKSEVEMVSADLRSATWNVTHTPSWCRPSRRTTVYRWNGRTLYAERTCSGDVLDRNSRQTIARIEVLLHVPDDLDGASIHPGCDVNPLKKGC